MGLLVQSRRKPYPYDVYIDSVGMMLLEDENGSLVSKKAKPLEAQPQEFAYGSMNPFRERIDAFRDLVMGLGEETQPVGRLVERYHFGIDIDPSIDGYWQKGPRFHAETLLAGQQVKQFFWANRPDGKYLHALTDRFIFYRTADGAWSISLDSWALLGPGGVLNWAAIFKWAGAGSFEGIYVGSNIGNLIEYNSTLGTWTQYVVATEGPDIGGAEWIATNGDELWVGKGNLIQKCESNPKTRANWAGFIRIGHASSKVTFLATNKAILHIFKEDGVFTVSTAGTDQELFPGLRSSKKTSNGVNAAAWLDTLWVPYGDSFFRLEIDGTMRPIGMEQLLTNQTEVRGQIVAFTGHNTWGGYEGVYDSLSGNSYLLKYGTWLASEDARLNSQVIFRDTHHGALKKWAGKRVVQLQVLPFDNDNDRLYAGFADGTMEWCYLPKGTPNPANDSRCEYTDQPSYMYLPEHHGSFKADPKIWNGFSVFGRGLSAEQYVTVEAKTDFGGAWVYIDDIAGVPVRYSRSGQRVDYQKADVPSGLGLFIRVGLWSKNAAGVATDGSPIVEGVGVHYAVRPSFQLEWTFRVKAGNAVGKHDGTTMVRKADYIRDIILAAVGKVGTVDVLMPDQTTETMIFVDYADQLQAFKTRNGLEWGLVAQAMQYRTVSEAGSTPSTPGLSHGTLEQFTHGQLEDENLL